MKRLYALLILFLFLNPLSAQILINEVCAAGYSAMLDEDQSVEDWIEFYNAGSTSVDMAGYKIKSIQASATKSWTFPSVIILPGQHFTVFFSGKNRRDYFDHWEVPVYPQLPVRYFPGTMEPPTTWKDPNFNDASWALSNGTVGYGDGDDSTIIAPALSVYQRISFNVADTGNIAIVALLIDYDDAYVAYLNGKEISRANIGAQGFPPAYNTLAFEEHEAVQYQTGDWSAFSLVAGSMLDTIIRPGINTLAIQTHNYIGGMNDLSMIPALLLGVIDTSVTYFPFPAQVFLHTDYQLNAGGCALTLLDAQGNISDQQTIGPMMQNHSRGRQPDGAANWCLFDVPTPDTTNFSTSCFSGYGEAPVIDLTSGFYTGTQLTGISSAMPGIIRWTNDGTDPGFSSPVYTNTISIAATQSIRARLFPANTNLLPGPSATASYFINENVTLPVVSLTTDPSNLFDPAYGIYMLGNNVADTTLTGIPFTDANFWQGWERPADVSFFDKDKVLRFQQPASIKIQGNWSKIFPQRGFTFDFDENYGGQVVNYRLFPGKPATTYHNFNLRNSGSDFYNTRMRDRLIQKTVQGVTDVDMMDGYPCVLFINGMYWGVYELREKQDKHYLANNSACDDDNVDFLEFDGSVIKGDNTSFFKMVNYIATTDMTLPSSYDSACAMLDVGNFCDYFITETFMGNLDWLGSYTNNIKFWKPHSGPGKWRYILWDTDISLQSDTLNQLSMVMNPPTINPHSLMLSAMLTNDSFRVYFINRYADLMNTAFYNLNMIQRTESFYTEMLPEMPRHFNLWGTGNSPFAPVCVQAPMDVPAWRFNVDVLEYIEYVRGYYVRNQVQSQFAMTSQVNVTLQTRPAGAGTIHLNTITPDSLPWTGVYFNGNPITMTATAAPGFKFSHWESNHVLNGNYPNAGLRTNVDSSDVFTAVFEQLESAFAAYPNPFYDDLTLYYEVPDAGVVTLKVFDMTGRLVKEILPSSNFQEAGAYQLNISASALALSQGMYLFQLNSPGYSKTLKLIGGRPKQ
ncbi:MAG: CotH kinase family protein [Bacteroidia bacterium]